MMGTLSTVMTTMQPSVMLTRRCTSEIVIFFSRKTTTSLVNFSTVEPLEVARNRGLLVVERAVEHERGVLWDEGMRYKPIREKAWETVDGSARRARQS